MKLVGDGKISEIPLLPNVALIGGKVRPKKVARTALKRFVFAKKESARIIGIFVIFVLRVNVREKGRNELVRIIIPIPPIIARLA